MTCLTQLQWFNCMLLGSMLCGYTTIHTVNVPCALVMCCFPMLRPNVYCCIFVSDCGHPCKLPNVIAVSILVTNPSDNWHICDWFVMSKTDYIYMCLNPKRVVTELSWFNYVNTMAAGALAHCVVRTSAAMPFAVWNGQVLVLPGEGFHLPMSCQWGGMVEIVNTCLCVCLKIDM